MVPLLEGLLRQSFPTLWSVNSFGGLYRDIEVTAFDCEVEPRVIVLYKVQSNLESKFSVSLRKRKA